MSTASRSPLFRDFEIKALRYLLGPDLANAWLEKLVSEAALVSYEYSSGGYFLTISHPVLPVVRAVYSDPIVCGSFEHIEVGFLAFVQNGELMLECHTWCEFDIPLEFRDLNVAVSIQTK